MGKLMLVIILAILWVMVMANRRLKRTVTQNADNIDLRERNASWGKGDCGCGTPRRGWKPLAMNRPDNTVLLICPQCMNLWEESMSMYGNKWRQVPESYARGMFDYNEEYGRSRIGS